MTHKLIRPIGPTVHEMGSATSLSATYQQDWGEIECGNCKGHFTADSSKCPHCGTEDEIEGEAGPTHDS